MDVPATAAGPDDDNAALGAVTTAVVTGCAEPIVVDMLGFTPVGAPAQGSPFKPRCIVPGTFFMEIINLI